MTLFLYCPKCQALLEKTDEKVSNGEKIIRECVRCYSVVEFQLKYKAPARIVGSMFDTRAKAPV